MGAARRGAEDRGRYRGNMRESINVDRQTGQPLASAPPATIAYPPEEERVERSAEVVKEIPLKKIAPDPGQPRKTFDPAKIHSLARTIAHWGQLQAAAVYWSEPAGKFVLLWGERRWRAAGIAGLKRLRCIVYPARPPDAEVRERQLVENLGREDFAPMDLAAALRDRAAQGLSQAEIADRLGISQAGVSRHLALLELPESVQSLVRLGTVPASIAYELRGLAEDFAGEIALRVQDEDLSREQVRKILRGQASARAPEPAPDIIHREYSDPPRETAPPAPEIIHREYSAPTSEAPPPEPEVVAPPPNVSRDEEASPPPETAPESRPGAIPAPEPSPAEPVKPSKRKEETVAIIPVGDWGTITLSRDLGMRCPDEDAVWALGELAKRLGRVDFQPGRAGFWEGDRVRISEPNSPYHGIEAVVVGQGRDEHWPRGVTINLPVPPKGERFVTAVDLGSLTLLPPIGEVDEEIRGHLNHGSPTSLSAAAKFRDALNRANVATLRQARDDLDGLFHKRTAVEAIEARLKKLEGGHR